MKSILTFALVLFGSTAFADTTIFNCVVPGSTSVSMSINLADDQSSDFVMASLSERSGSSLFFSQLEKGEVAEQIKNGYLQILAMTEKTSQEDGVIVNTGFLALGAEANGTFGGFLAARGNIYPLSCKK